MEQQQNTAEAPVASELIGLAAGSDPVAALQENWQKQAFLFEGNWLDTSEVDFDLDKIGEFLKSSASERIYVRETGADPGAPHQMVTLDDRPLSAQLEGRRIHITALYLEELDPRFQRMVDAFVDRLQPLLAGTDQRRLEATLGLFIGSGESVVPFHVDFEHNFLVQLLGEKTMHIFPNNDYEMLPEEARESLAKDMSDSRYLPYRADFEARAKAMHLRPGISTYQPALSPHWVKSTGGVTMSLLLSLFTSDELDTRLAHLANRALRRTGLRPSQVGRRPRLDRAKAGAFGFARDALQQLKPIRYSRGRWVDVRTGKVVPGPAQS